jgi:hypothetical protein
MKLGRLLYFVLWVIGVFTVKGFWMTIAAAVVPVVGPFEGVLYLLRHFGIV